VEKVEAKIDNNVVGDMPYETAFADCKDFSGVKFATHIVQKQGGYPVLDLTVSNFGSLGCCESLYYEKICAWTTRRS
jgi:hypothetical protein